MSDGGKGDTQRPGKGYSEGWARIFAKKCQKCGEVTTDYPVTAAGDVLLYCRTCYNAQRREAYQKRKDTANANRRQQYADNTNGLRVKCRAAIVKRYAEYGALVRQWEASLPKDKRQELWRSKQARYRAELTDCYVRRLMTHPDRTTLRDVPKSLVEAKRELLKIERYLNANGK